MKKYKRQFLDEKKLTYKQKQDLPDSAFAIVKGDERKYPLDTEERARNALARVSQNGTPEEQKKVKSKVHSKFPDIEISDK